MKEPNVRLTLDELASVVRHELATSIEHINVEIERVKTSKERLHKALNDAGFNIPEGLTLDEWIPYIERAVRS